SLTKQASGKNTVAIGSSESTLGGPNPNWVAYYSSKGPTFDGRIKPDVVAPGDSLTSAKSNGVGGPSCMTTTMSGTSMATPAVAGASLLIRNYFSSTSNDFWAGHCDTSYQWCGAFTPSGVMTKALLLHSGTGMQMYHGGGTRDVMLGDAPDFMQGYGRVTLKNILPLQGQNSFDLFVIEQNTKAMNSRVFTVTVKDSSGPLKVTLSWYDPPSTGGTTTKTLLHDLDLKVQSPAGDIYYGNGGNSADRVNNNEQVVAEDPLKGDWKVYVNSKALPMDNRQQFALIITSLGTVQGWGPGTADDLPTIFNPPL
ncbi:peptidase S8/S53 domain-containing protein, partial [Ochromonadaceae sp. CCMP2298]